MHTFTVDLADVDRGVYEQLSLRVARHPSETASNVLLRVLAYALEYEEGIFAVRLSLHVRCTYKYKHSLLNCKAVRDKK